jgi:hypothetical protein
MSGYPAIGDIDAIAPDTAMAKRLWSLGQEVTGISFL